MSSVSLFFLPPTLWWAAAVLLSLLLTSSASVWLFWRRHRRAGAAIPGHLLWGFAVFAALWWGFGFMLALLPLQELDEFGQWARASSYVTIPLWIGGIAWGAALLVARLLGAAKSQP